MITIFITINGGAGILNNGQVTSEMETSCKQNIPNAQQIGFEILEKEDPRLEHLLIRMECTGI